MATKEWTVVSEAPLNWSTATISPATPGLCGPPTANAQFRAVTAWERGPGFATLLQEHLLVGAIENLLN